MGTILTAYGFRSRRSWSPREFVFFPGRNSKLIASATGCARFDDADKCILYKQIALKVSESNRSVNFICEQPGVLEPRKPIQYVYDGRRCAHVSELTSLLPCSRLEHKETPGGTLYTYTVDTFPLEPVKLCYVCIFPEPPDPRTPRLNYLRKVPCPLLIEVAATTATSTGKTNDSPTLVCGVSCFVGILPLGLVSTLGVY